MLSSSSSSFTFCVDVPTAEHRADSSQISIDLVVTQTSCLILPGEEEGENIYNNKILLLPKQQQQWDKEALAICFNTSSSSSSNRSIYRRNIRLFVVLGYIVYLIRSLFLCVFAPPLILSFLLLLLLLLMLCLCFRSLLLHLFVFFPMILSLFVSLSRVIFCPFSHLLLPMIAAAAVDISPLIFSFPPQHIQHTAQHRQTDDLQVASSLRSVLLLLHTTTQQQQLSFAFLSS